MTKLRKQALELVRNAAIYTDRVTIELTIPEYENILRAALQEQLEEENEQ